MSARDFFNRARLRVFFRQTILPIVLAWVASLLTMRRGWTGDWPGSWNWLSIIIITAGLSIFIWCLGLKLVRALGGEHRSSYLLVSGPY